MPLDYEYVVDVPITAIFVVNVKPSRPSDNYDIQLFGAAAMGPCSNHNHYVLFAIQGLSGPSVSLNSKRFDGL
jgi:hypothetical protein